MRKIVRVPAELKIKEFRIFQAIRRRVTVWDIARQITTLSTRDLS